MPAYPASHTYPASLLQLARKHILIFLDLPGNLPGNTYTTKTAASALLTAKNATYPAKQQRKKKIKKEKKKKIAKTCQVEKLTRQHCRHCMRTPDLPALHSTHTPNHSWLGVSRRCSAPDHSPVCL
jgi:hypothetical protein